MLQGAPEVSSTSKPLSREEFLAKLRGEEIPRGRRKGRSREEFLAFLKENYPNPRMPSATDAFTGSLAETTADLIEAPALAVKAVEDVSGTDLSRGGSAAPFVRFFKGTSEPAEQLRGNAQAVYPPLSRGQGSYLGEQLPAALGSTVPLVGAGLAGGAGVALAGAAQNAVSTYYDVLDATGDSTKAWEGAAGGALLGSLEAFGVGALGKAAGPVGKLLGKADQGGKVRQLLLNLAATGAKEGIQEGVQQKLQDELFNGLTGQDISTWKEAAKAGAGVGVIFELMTGVPLSVADRVHKAAGVEASLKAKEAEIQGAPQAAQEAPGAKQAQEATKATVEPQAAPEAAQAATEQPGPEVGSETATKEALPGAEPVVERGPAAPPEADVRAAEKQGMPHPEEAAKAAVELGEEAVKRTKETIPEKLYAGPSSGIDVADVAADVRRLWAKIKARVWAQNQDSDVLGNRLTLNFQRWWTNRLAPYERLQEHRKAAGADVSPEADIINQEDHRKGKTKDRQKRAEKRLLDPIVKIIKDSGINPSATGIEEDPGVNAYLIARHAESRNEIISKRTEGKNEAGIGMTTSHAKMILRSVENGPKAEAYAKLARRFDKIIEETRDIWVESGLESKEYVDQLRKTFKNYAPAKTDVEGHRMGTGKGTSIQGRESKSATGRESLPDDPLSFAVSDLLRTISRAEKNKVSQTLAADIEANPTFWGDIAKVTRGRTIDTVVDGKVMSVADPSIRSDPNVVAFKRNGEQFYIEFPEKFSALAKALNNSDLQMADGLQRALGAVSAITRTFAKLRTAWSPEFLLTNLQRDLQTGLFSSRQYGKQFAKQMRKELLSSFRTLVDSKRKGEFSGPDAKYLDEYEASGAPITYLDFKTVSQIASEIEADFKEGVAPSAVQKATKQWRNMLGLMEGASEVMENTTRFAAFKAGRKTGMSIDEAAHVAKNITVNFERKGELGNIVNAFYAFSTAAIGGTRLTYKMLKHPATRKMILGAAAGAMLWDQLARSMMGKEDDGSYVWDNISTADKSRYWIIPKFWTDEPRDFLRFPMPQGLNWIFYTAMEVGAVASGDREGSEAAANSATAALDAFNPFGGAESPLQAISPTITDPIVEIQTNRDYAGRMISPEWGNGPDAYKYFPDVNSAARIIAKKLNEWTGGDEYTPGTIDISPETIEHVSDFIFGGLGSFAGKLYATGEAKITGEPVDDHNIPILSRFMGEVSPWASNTRFKDSMEELRTEQRRAGKGDMKRGEKLLDREQRKKLVEGRRVEKRLRELSDKLNEARSSGSSEEQDRIELEMDKIRQQFLKKYRKEDS